MVWFKKKEVKFRKLPDISELPQFPELPELPPLQDMDTEFPALPSLPREIGESSAKAAKRAVMDQGYTMIRPEENKPRTMEISESPQTMKQIITGYPRETSQETFAMPEKFMPETTRKIEPIFVRLDKYETSLESFNEIKRKLIQIETLLHDIKEIKRREDIELEEWEKELQTIKVWLNNIDKTLFSKLD